MSDGRPRRIVLIGLSGGGKSAVSKAIARRLHWERIDTDDLIEAAAGREISRIFADEGEPAFRARERAAVAEAATHHRVIIATGGGVVLDPANRAALWQDAFVVHLDAPPAALVRRMAASKRGAASRPLLAGDPLARLEALRDQRAPLYALADWVVRTDGLQPEQVAEEVISAWERRSAALIHRPYRMEDLGAGSAAEPEDPDFACRVTTPGGTYPAYAGWDVLARLPAWMKDAGLSETVHIVADSRVAELHGPRLLSALQDGGCRPVLHALSLTEAYKTLDSAAQVFDRLVAARAERRHVILAFGGGVATDLGGFVAATYLRGLPLVQVPTSLLGMVDAAIGGKVAVNHREGKNLIGAFYQPRLVVAEGSVLPTLPARELTAGWGEVIKHGLIMDPELLDWLETDSDALLRLEPEPVARMLRRNLSLKARVVSADEREDGLRMILNYGHTIGHGLEAATGYGALLHGEAVAIGMQAEAFIARELGLIDDALVERQTGLIQRYGLPAKAPAVPVERVMAAMTLDKKVVGGTMRFVLLERAGSTTIRGDVPLELVQAAVERVTAP